MHVWLAEYQPCHYESRFGVIGVYKTRKAARIGIKQHKLDHLTFSWGIENPAKWEHWRVVKTEVQE